MFQCDPFLFSPPPPNTLTKTIAVGRGGERTGGTSAYDYELNFEPSLLFLPRILECEGKRIYIKFDLLRYFKSLL